MNSNVFSRSGPLNEYFQEDSEQHVNSNQYDSQHVRNCKLMYTFKNFKKRVSSKTSKLCIHIKEERDIDSVVAYSLYDSMTIS